MKRLHPLVLPFTIGVVVLAAFTVALRGQDKPSIPQAGTPTAASSAAVPTLKVREELIGEMAPNSKLQLARSSENRLAWVEKTSKDQLAGGNPLIVKLDGKQVGGVYDEVASLRFSKDEQHLAFTAKRKSKWVLVLDGEERTKEYGRLSAPTLSANGKFFAVAGCREKKCRLIVNGDELTPEFEDASAPSFTPDGAHYGYFAKRNKRWVLMLDNKEYGPEMGDFLTWQMDPEGKHVAVAGYMNGGWTWLVDGTPGPSFDVISDIVFSPDYKHYAYGGTNAKWGLAKHKTRGAMVVDGRIAGEYQGSGFGGGWQSMFGQSTEIATGLRNLSPDFHGVSSPQYSPQGKLVYAGRRSDDDVVVMVDGAPGPVFENIVSPIALAVEGEHIAYVGKRGELFVEVRDHKPGASFPGKRAESLVETIMISSDGEHLAYQIVRGGGMFKQGRTDRALRRIVIDGQAGREYDALDITDLALRANAKRYCYTVIGAERGFDRVVFNGAETKLYNDVFYGSLEFVDDQTIEFVARDGQRFVKVTAVLE